MKMAALPCQSWQSSHFRVTGHGKRFSELFSGCQVCMKRSGGPFLNLKGGLFVENLR